MAPAISSSEASSTARKLVRINGSFRRRTSASRRLSPSPSPPPKKFKPIDDIMARASHVVLKKKRADYSNIRCEQCGYGDQPDELLLCDKCDNGFHMKCVRPIVVRVPIGSWLCPKCSGERRVRSFSQSKIIDFFGIKKCANIKDKYACSNDARKHRRRSGSLVLQKRRRRILPYIPAEDSSQRVKQMGSLASALTALRMEFRAELTYMPGMASRRANQSKFEDGCMQVLSKEDAETLEHCRAMYRKGECPPLIVVFDSCEGYLNAELIYGDSIYIWYLHTSRFSFKFLCSFTVEADGLIKDMTFIAEYTGDVDYIKNREKDDCDSMMTLLLAKNPSKSLVICPNKRGNIARFINGINNHNPEGKKKQNCKCVRYSVNGECRVFLVATRDIAKGERLYYDYNGYEHEYPTHHFI